MAPMRMLLVIVLVVLALSAATMGAQVLLTKQIEEFPYVALDWTRLREPVPGSGAMGNASIDKDFLEVLRAAEPGERGNVLLAKSYWAHVVRVGAPIDPDCRGVVIDAIPLSFCPSRIP